ncbi:NADP(H)-dependent aldo-keto reductase [Luteirhabdus pelagi]|uniref:NADP(H)-dependent aldo-keto reductase n=1 Tax=Luteirhabdus pelagi TaxID=2792783 RepID=UPI00193A76BA|nr:NADP(H)-dependent aldo-keto reductase [Luteirhabdus pelagi]
MKHSLLPNTDLSVSEICLGTMTWGEQNSEVEAHEQLNYAIENDANFIDTAEMYPIPANPETQGRTESYIGSWLKQTGKRKDIVLASKIAGPNRKMSHIRNPLDFSKASIEKALHDSLKRLQTDYLDLYQLHWPERHVNVFGIREYSYGRNAEWEENFEVVLDALQEFVKAGKIRYVGLSNETPWGAMKYAEIAKKDGLKMATIQNAYNLLNRRDEIALTEVLEKENYGYLAYSPLAFGVLTGKYLNNAKPEKSRVTLFPSYQRYSSDASRKATKAYHQLASEYDLSLTQLALAFVNQQPFVSSTIIGATNLQQLEENINSAMVTLSPEILRKIEAIHREQPNPAP